MLSPVAALRGARGSRRHLVARAVLILQKDHRYGSIVLGLLGMAISAIAFWVPSPWLDEAATAHIISYPISDMANLWKWEDLVHAPYYILMHAVTRITAIDPFWLRLPSVIAVGVGTSAMAETGHYFGGRNCQIIYAACYSLLPRTTAMAIEARSYAISSMFAALILYELVRLRKPATSHRWLLLGLLISAAIFSQLFTIIPVCGALVVALFLYSKRNCIRLIVTAAAAVTICAPFIIAASKQRQQIGWLGEGRYSFADQAFVESWFTSRWDLNPQSYSNGLHAVAIGLSFTTLVTILLALCLAHRRHYDRLLLGAFPVAFTICVLWGYSLSHQPILLGRYLTSCAPFMSLLIGECLMMIPRNLNRILAALLVAGSVFIIASQRQPYSKIPSLDYSFIATTVKQMSRNSDGLLMDPGTSGIDSARSAVASYPRDFVGLDDIAQPSRPKLTHVFATDPPIQNLGEVPDLPNRIILVSQRTQSGGYSQQLIALGYQIDDSSSGPAHTVSRWTKK